MKIEIVDYDKQFLMLSWSWLNDPEIREMTDTPTFSKEEQEIWFEGLENKNDYKIWGITCEGNKIGAFGIKNIDNGTGEYWGYIGEKEYWGKGIGKAILRIAIEYAKKLGLNKLYLRVLKDNIKAIKLYSDMKFSIIENQGNKYIMEIKING